MPATVDPARVPVARQSEPFAARHAEYLEFRAKVVRTKLHRDLRRLLATADDLIDEAGRLAGQLDDCDPAAHPFRFEHDDRGFAARDLTALARVVDVVLGGIRCAL